MKLSLSFFLVPRISCYNFLKRHLKSFINVEKSTTYLLNKMFSILRREYIMEQAGRVEF